MFENFKFFKIEELSEFSAFNLQILKISGQKKIPAGSLFLLAIKYSPEENDKWEKPEEFIPERFLKEGKFDIAMDDFFPFSVGLRKCPGDKFALINLFIISILLIQKTKNIKIKLKEFSNEDIKSEDYSSILTAKSNPFLISMCQ